MELFLSDLTFFFFTSVASLCERFLVYTELILFIPG